MATGYVPDDLATDILSRLPIKSLLRFRCVNKTWKSLLKSSHFITMNLKNPNNKDRGMMFVQDREPDSINTNTRIRRIRLLTCDTFDVRLDFSLPLKLCFYVVGSCNGLVCLYDVIRLDDVTECRVIVCNPCLNEHKIIPQPNLYLPEKANLRSYVSGFCYDSINKEYKVVWLCKVNKKGKGYSSLFQVYTLGTNSWRKVGLLDIYIYYWEYRAFVNGAMHWLGVKNKRRCVVSFDVSSEEFQLLPSPDCFAAGEPYKYKRIDVYKGLLCVVNWVNYASFEIWVMEEYGVEGSWTRMYAIKLAQLILNPEILGFGVNGEVFVNIHGRLMVYYPNNEFKEIVNLDGRVRFLGTLNYTESLVSLEEGN